MSVDEHAPPEPGSAGPVLTVVGRASPDELATVVDAAQRHWADLPFRLETVGFPESHVAQLRSMVPVVAHPWTPDRDLGKILEKATVLAMVLSESRGAGGGTSTKIYPYLDSGKPILAINPTASDHQLLQRWGNFRALYRPDVDSALAALAGLVDPRASGAEHRQADVAGFRERYSWEVVAEQVRDVLAEIDEQPRRSARQ